MTHWLILRTDFRKEQYVADAVRRLTFDAWVPVQLIACRPQIARRVSSKAHLKTYREICLLPRRVFAAVPHWAVLQGELSHIRHLIAVEHDGASRPISVPAAEITRFRTAIDAENTAALALATRPSRKQKAKWRSLHEALVEMIEQAKSQLEQAA